MVSLKLNTSLLLLYSITKSQTRYPLRMTNQVLSHFGFLDLPNPHESVCGHGHAVHGVIGELAVPNPATVASQLRVLLELVFLLIQLPYFTRSITTACRKEHIIISKSAPEDVVLKVRLELLLGLELLPVRAGPDVAEPSAVACHEFGCVLGERNGTDANRFRVFEEVPDRVRGQVPDAETALLVSKIHFNLIRM